MWAAMAKGEASSRSWRAEHGGVCTVVSGGEDESERAMDAVLGGDSENDGDPEGKKSAREKRAEGPMEAKANAEEDQEMQD